MVMGIVTYTSPV